jgi:hypothetical protein
LPIVQAKLAYAQTSLEQWKSLAQELLPGRHADAAAVRQELQRLQGTEAELAAVRSREAKLQSALAEKSLQNLEIRWRLAAAREATNPSLAQVSRLDIHKNLYFFLSLLEIHHRYDVPITDTGHELRRCCL